MRGIRGGKPRTSGICCSKSVACKGNAVHCDITMRCLLRQYRKANLHKQIQCLQRQYRSLFAGFKVFPCPGTSMALLPVGARNSDTSPLQRYLHPCLLIQLARCSYSIANHPGGLLSIRVFTLRDCCAIMATIGICDFCCRPFNVSNLCFLFVWRMDIICFRNSYCRIGGAKNE